MPRLRRRVLGVGDARDRSAPRLQPLVLCEGCRRRPGAAGRDLPDARGRGARGARATRACRRGDAASSTRSTCATRRQEYTLDDPGRQTPLASRLRRRDVARASTTRTTRATATRTQARRSSSSSPRSRCSASWVAPSPSGSPRRDGRAAPRRRDAVFDGQRVAGRRRRSATSSPPAPARGPAIIEEPTATTVVPPGLDARVDRSARSHHDRKATADGDDRRRPDHHRGDPQRAQLGRRRDERDADPLRLHVDHLRAQGLLGRAARRRPPRARAVVGAADLPRQPRGLHAA